MPYLKLVIAFHVASIAGIAAGAEEDLLLEEDFGRAIDSLPVAAFPQPTPIRGTWQLSGGGAYTSDGQSRWLLGAGESPLYRVNDSQGSMKWHGGGLSYIFPDLYMNSHPYFLIRIEGVSLSANERASSFMVGARKSHVELGWGYDFRIIGDGLWEVRFVTTEGSVGDFVTWVDHDSVTDATLELEVGPNWQRLKINEQFIDTIARPVAGFYDDPVFHRPFHLSMNTLSDGEFGVEIGRITVRKVEKLSKGIPWQGGVTFDRWRRSSIFPDSPEEGVITSISRGELSHLVSRKGMVRDDLMVNVDDLLNYDVVIPELILNGSSMSSVLIIGARLPDVPNGGHYEFRPYIQKDSDKVSRPKWTLWYRDDQGKSKIIRNFHCAEAIPGVSYVSIESLGDLHLTNLEVRVRGNEQQLFMNGYPLDPEVRQTLGSPVDGRADYAFTIAANSTVANITYLEAKCPVVTVQAID